MNHAMMLAGSAGPIEFVEPPGKWVSLALTVSIHVVLAVFLFYGVRWQSKPIEAVRVELIRALPAPEAAVPPPSTPEPQPAPEPEPAPPPKLIEPPKAKPVPPPPAPAPAKPDIVQKEKPKKKPEPPPKAEPPARPNRMAERLAADDKRLSNLKRNEAIDRELNAARNAQLSAERNKAVDEWIEKIRGKVRGKINLPPNIRDNPEAVFEITLLISGEVRSVKLRQSSGSPALDAAIERAISNSSPFPKPSSPEVFERDLILRLRPMEN